MKTTVNKPKVHVICENHGNSERIMVIGTHKYVMDNYEIESLIEALEVVKNTPFCRVERVIREEIENGS